MDGQKFCFMYNLSYHYLNRFFPIILVPYCSYRPLNITKKQLHFNQSFLDGRNCIVSQILQFGQWLN